MRKRIIFIVSLVVAALLFAVAVWAHSGRTDSQGGHTNRSTGEYHFHHGYPAHQHTNGACPYDSDNNTEQSSGGEAESNKGTAAQTKPKVETSKAPEKAASENEASDKGEFPEWAVYLLIGGLIIAPWVWHKAKNK